VLRRTDTDRILLAHGGGGSLTRDLIRDLLLPLLGSEQPELADSSPVPGHEDIHLTIDAFVVKPLFFPGGDIGSLAIHGTLNDLAVSGAKPLAVAVSFVVEEGFEVDALKRVLRSAGEAARGCDVRIITGDTKVVARGDADGLFVITGGVGAVVRRVLPSGGREGDAILLSGSIGEHGVAVMSAREGIAFETSVESDSASVWPLVEALLRGGVEIRAMRDPTRGGVAACCNELADSSGVSIVLDEKAIPVKAGVAAACEMLGLDPLTVANEGKVLFFVPERDAGRAVDLLRSLPTGHSAAVIGRAVSRRDHAVYLTTRYGGERIVEMPYGEELPRIC